MPMAADAYRTSYPARVGRVDMLLAYDLRAARWFAVMHAVPAGVLLRGAAATATVDVSLHRRKRAERFHRSQRRA